MPDEQLVPWRVLLVDDDQDDYHLTLALLKAAQGRKFTLDWAPTFQAGQQLLQANRYRAVLVDYDLGPATGVELIRQVAARGYPAPFILYSGRASLEIELEAMEAGASLVLAKQEATPLLLERLIRYAIERKQDAEALRLSNERYQTLFDSIDEGFCIIEMIYDQAGKPVDYRFVEINQAFEEQTGLVNALGKSIRQLAPQHEEHWFEIYGQVALTGRSVRFENLAKALGRWYSVNAFRVGEPAERKVGVLFTDITARKHRELNAEFLAEIQADLSNATAAAETLRLVGDKIYRYLGVARLCFCEIDLQQDEVTVIYDRREAGLPGGPQQAPLSAFLGEDLAQELAAGAVVAIDDVEADGRTAAQVEVYRLLQVRAQILAPYLSDGRWKFLLLAQRRQPYPWRADERELMSALSARIYLWLERAQVEASLRESEERFRTMADGTPVIIWVTDAAGRIEFINRAYQDFFGVTPERARSAGWQPLVHPADQGGYAQAFVDCLRERRTFRAEARVRRFDGQWRWIYSQGQPRFSPAGEFLGMGGSSVDITGRKRAEADLQAFAEQLQRSNQDLEDFAFMVSHDLHEPLRKIRTFGERLETQVGNSLDGQERVYFERIQQAAVRMQGKLDGLLTYSRVATQGRPFEAVDLNRIATEVLSDLEVRLKETGGKVELGELPVITADPLQMQQLLQNLIGNALKFHRPGRPPSVKVFSRPAEDSRAALVVADDGIGFDMALTEKMFKPFQRLVGKSAYEGAGLGLAICQKIVERHGGAIAATGQPGVGATFTVTLPLSPKQN